MYYPDHRLAKSLKNIRLEQARRIHNDNKNNRRDKLATQPVDESTTLDGPARKVA